MLIFEPTKRLVIESLYHLRNPRNMSTPITRFSESTIKWRKICEKIFGSRHGFTWRLNPEEGKIYFSKNGIELIKANAFIVATTWFTGKTKLNWLWAWGRTKNRKLIMDRLSEDNRFTAADVSEYEKDLGDYKQYFQKNAFQLDLSKKADQVTEAQLRAYTLDILDGQYVYEAEIGYGSGHMNVIFVIAGSKSIKQRVPEPSPSELAGPPEPDLEKPEKPHTESENPEPAESREPEENPDTEDSDNSDQEERPKQTKRPPKSTNKKEKSKPAEENADEWDW